MSRSQKFVFGLAIVGLALAIPAARGTARLNAQQAASAAASNQHIEGDWVRLDLAGAGSFGGLGAQIPAAELSAEGRAMVPARGARGGANGPAPAAQGARGGPAPAAPAAQPGRAPLSFDENRVHEVGEPYIVVDRPCGNAFGGGALGINPDSGGIHLVEQKDEVVLAPERGGIRHIFMDGRKHPDLAGWAPSASGHSVGHYEGNVLVVDTVGLAQGGVPGGGYRTPESHLTERMSVSPDGKQLTIQYTYTDPKIYAKPHTWSYKFERAPAAGGYSYALDDWCDASDPIERQSIVPPPQR